MFFFLFKWVMFLSCQSRNDVYMIIKYEKVGNLNELKD